MTKRVKQTKKKARLIPSDTRMDFRVAEGPGVAIAGAFNVKAFCGRYRIVRPDLTRLTGYSLRAVDQWAAGGKPSPAAKMQLRETARLFHSLADIMEPGYIGEWLKTPNEAFDGSTPLQVVERGESDRIWRMIHQLQAGEAV